MLDQFRKNYEYDYWANDKFVKALAEMAQPPEKTAKILWHILFARDVWLSRFADPYPPYILSECRQKLDELHEKWKKYLTNLKSENLSEKITFANTQGKRFEHIVQNVLVHVVHHSHNHRGQLATLARQGEGKRPNTDYIDMPLK